MRKHHLAIAITIAGIIAAIAFFWPDRAAGVFIAPCFFGAMPT